MSRREHLHSVVTALQPVLKGVSADDLGAPTLCTDFDVRVVANDMLGTREAMRRIGASEPMDAEDPWGTSGDHMSDQWRDDLDRTLTEYAEGEMGCSQGAFGPEVAVPEEAAPFDKVLAQAGRDPRWSAT